MTLREHGSTFLTDADLSTVKPVSQWASSVNARTSSGVASAVAGPVCLAGSSEGRQEKHSEQGDVRFSTLKQSTRRVERVKAIEPTSLKWCKVNQNALLHISAIGWMMSLSKGSDPNGCECEVPGTLFTEVRVA